MSPPIASRVVAVLELGREDWRETWQALWGVATSAGLGGVLLRGGSRDQWSWVRGQLERLAGRRPLVCADLEQGAASQVEGFPWLPRLFSIGCTADPSLSARMGAEVALQAKALGVDAVLAPVADLLYPWTHPVIGTRSFGATPSQVACLVAAFVEACQEQGVYAVAKHFPGHGRASQDSHHVLPKVEVSREEWEQTDLVPFLAACRQGVWGIMVGHLWYPAFDPCCRPASRSPSVLRDLLRGRVGFAGVILTDSMEMAGAGEEATVAAEEALSHGADLVIADLIPRSGTRAPRPSPRRVPLPPHPLAREVARRSVSWIGEPALPRGGIRLSVVPDGAGTTDWAIPLVEALAQHGGSSPAIHCLAVSWTSDAALARQSLEDLLASGEPGVVACFGALDAAASAAGVVPVVLAGDATAASQEAVALVLSGRMVPQGRPDAPWLTCPSPPFPGSPSARTLRGWVEGGGSAAEGPSDAA